MAPAASNPSIRQYEIDSPPQDFMSRRSRVAIVDDDESIRESLPVLLRELGYSARAFSSAEEFLASDTIDEMSCLILDVALRSMTGPELQRELTRRQLAVPIVFITAHHDETLRSQLLGEGAVEYLFKPFSESALVDALRAATRFA
jgi:FixJ family two-component response regulator